MTALLTAFVPAEYIGTTFEEVAVINGNRVPSRYHTREHAGHVVLDIPLGFYQRLLAGPQGLKWADANPEIAQWLGQEDRRTMFCNSFPGAHRAPPLAPCSAPPAAPVMIRMVAPDGMTGCCVEGVDLPIGEDRTVTVTEAVAETLRSHGFRPA